MVYRGHIHNGVVVVDGAPDLPEGAEVRLEVLTSTEPVVKKTFGDLTGLWQTAEPSPTDEKTSRVERTYGLMGWTGDPDVLRMIAEDDEFGVMESR
jgi:hypothetical protein